MEQRAILLRHDDHFLVAADPLFLEAPPAEIIPPLGDAGSAVADLPVEREGAQLRAKRQLAWLCSPRGLLMATGHADGDHVQHSDRR